MKFYLKKFSLLFVLLPIDLKILNDDIKWVQHHGQFNEGYNFKIISRVKKIAIRTDFLVKNVMLNATMTAWLHSFITITKRPKFNDI